MVFRLLIALACALILSGSNSAFALDPDREIVQLQHTAWTSANGVPSGVWSLTQSPDGYLWLGTGLGLYIFDGVHFEKFHSSDGSELQGIDVTAVSESPSGTIWTGFQSGGVSSIRNGKVTNYLPGDGLPSGFVVNIAVEDDGVVWASASGGLTRFDGKRWQTIGPSWSLPAGTTTFLAMAGDGTLWVKLAGDGGIFYLKSGTHQFIRTGILSASQSGFARDHRGRVWAVDRNDLLHEFPIFGTIRKSHPNEPNQTSSLMMFDSDETIWGSTRSATGLWPAMADIQGIYRRRSPNDGEQTKSGTNDFNSFGTGDGLSSSVAATIYEDHEGNIWVGTNVGLDRFSPANVVSERAIPFTSATGYLSALGRDGLYFTADGALYRVQSGGTSKLVTPTFSVRPGLFLANKDGSLWFNDLYGKSTDIWRWNGAVAARISQPADPYEYDAGGVADDGALWVSNKQFGVARLDGDRWVRVLPPPKTSSAIVDIIQSDNHGGMWLSNYTDQTVFHADAKTVREVGHNFLHIGGIQVIYPYSGGTLFGGDSGVARFDGRNFHTILSRDVEPLTLVSGIVESPDKHVYVNTGVGIVRIQTAELNRAFDQPARRLNYELLDSHDGLRGVAEQNCNCNTATRGPDSRLWFITGNGVAWIDGAHFYRNMLAPPVYLRSVSDGSTLYPARSDLTLPAGSANLRIDYTALSFTDPDRMHFLYKLDGVDSDWVEAGTRRQAYYTRLGPGTYHFHVTASNDDGVWNRVGATQTFTIPPTFLQSNFFLVLCMLAGSVVLWLLYALRLQQVTAGIHSRMQERLSERERIARDLHDTLLQGIFGLILRFQSIANRMRPDEPIRTMMEDALKRADDVLSEGRDSVRDLRSSQSTLDISDAFAAAGEAQAVGSVAKFNVLTEGTVRMLHPAVRDEVTRIGNEAIANAMMHSKAENIEVVAAYLPNRLVVTVSDDGAGIPENILQQGRQGHFGLTGMRERAERIKAIFSVASSVGAGTTVTLVVPGAIAYADRRAVKLRSWLRNPFASGDL